MLSSLWMFICFGLQGAGLFPLSNTVKRTCSETDLFLLWRADKETPTETVPIERVHIKTITGLVYEFSVLLKDTQLL